MTSSAQGPANPPQWHQINIQFVDNSAAEREAIAYLGPALRLAESSGLITSWFFIRKPWWRFRCLPASRASAHKAANVLDHAASSLRDAGHAVRWVRGIYEPETHAFGGHEAMAIAHDLFHSDSHHIFEHLGDGTRIGRARRRELSLLLSAALMRAAGQDRYEQGDIWAKVSDHRPAENRAKPEQWHAFKTAVQRLITVDTGPETALRTGVLKPASDWLTFFERAGRALKTLSAEGLLTRGIRAIIAHHVIFHWNRIGLPYQIQADIASAAKEGVFER